MLHGITLLLMSISCYALPILFSGRSTYSSVHCRPQSVSCCSVSSVEQSSKARRSLLPPLSLHLLLSS